MKYTERTKFFGLILIFTLFACGFSAVSAQTWKITSSRGGGLRGINKSYTLDDDGNLYRSNNDLENFEKIDKEKTAEIGKLIKELNLPRTKLKIVKGLKIYDGVYTGLTINLNGKDYKVEGTSFNDAKYAALTKKQTATLEKLKQLLEDLNGFLPDVMTNKM